MCVCVLCIDIEILLVQIVCTQKKKANLEVETVCAQEEEDEEGQRKKDEEEEEEEEEGRR